MTAARQALDALREELLAMRQPGGYWCGELSGSALSTATAISALAALSRSATAPNQTLNALIRRGVAYLDSQQNRDGGYGDTDRSHSNIATSYLVLAARTLAADCLGDGGGDHERLAALRDYITRAGALDGLRLRYGRDKTFVVPILTNLAIAGLVSWSDVPRLPFEAAVFPGSMYRFLQMPVVSYAIPALVAIGQVHHFLGPRPWWPVHRIRGSAVAPTIRVLQRMQPDSGGYLEATPLTSFVLMSLAASGRGDHPVARRCAEFLIASIRDDGSWPIDTNLATWVTSLAIHALARDPQDDGRWASGELIAWHLSCQHQQRHPFTGAGPGGWGWTDLSGAVPDGDDTPAAILAISHYARLIAEPAAAEAAGAATGKGLRWLADLQNRDGGLPTFCRGWGKLPFDRSSTDLTAHLIRAIDTASADALGGGVTGRAIGFSPLAPRLARARRRALVFLRRQQRPDGRWVPLWFGNQDDREEENPIYGTGRVLLAIAGEPSMAAPTDRAVDFLLSQQNADGGWGGGPSRAAWLTQRAQQTQPAQATATAPAVPGERGGDETSAGTVASSLEETAVALEGLVAVLRSRSERAPNGQGQNGQGQNDQGQVDQGAGDQGGGGRAASRQQPSAQRPESTNLLENDLSPRVAHCRQAIIRSVGFLVNAIDSEAHHEPWPIGFYFAKLWYHERLYPLVLTMAALGSALDLLAARTSRE